MSTGVIITIVLLAVLLVAAAALAKPLAGSSRGLRHRFGPEYERAVAQHGGDTKAAEKELGERAGRHGHLRQRPLTAEARAQYTKEWAGIQEQFVDAPAAAVAEAERLLDRLARDRGFSADSADERLAAMSVHYPRHVDGYRQLHETARRPHEEPAATEHLRESLVHAHALFAELVGEKPERPDRQRETGPEPRHAPWTAIRRRSSTRGSTS
ncbi:hypothetical protein ACFQLX_14850 [Streptomyces polyrhachis]|uniref:Secreted protein n=1 Tax=Streptomyces polyrhachis TaxID=1282885 RepID=A0ABW2GH17_9ACTN